MPLNGTDKAHIATGRDNRWERFKMPKQSEWILTLDERMAVIAKADRVRGGDHHKDLLQAQDAKTKRLMIEWLEQKCDTHYHSRHAPPRMLCDECIDELKAGVK